MLIRKDGRFSWCALMRRIEPLAVRYCPANLFVEGAIYLSIPREVTTKIAYPSVSFFRGGFSLEYHLYLFKGLSLKLKVHDDYEYIDIF